MGRACGTNWGNEKWIQGFWLEDLNEKDHLGDIGVDGRIILKWRFTK
jgi:hypothetical protein